MIFDLPELFFPTNTIYGRKFTVISLTERKFAILTFLIIMVNIFLV